MPRAEKHQISEAHKINRNVHSPYNQSGRKQKTRSSSWAPSIWNMLTFWKSRNASHSEDEDEEYDGDASADNNEVSNLLTLEETKPIIGEETRDSWSPFLKPQGDDLLDSDANPQNDPYVAPLPPSSPFSPSQDPLAKVTDYIDNVLRPRGGECTDIEAMGLSMLIQSSVNHSGTHHGTPPNPFLPRTRPSTLSFLPPVQPMFTRPDTDINAILAASAPSSPSHMLPVFNNTPAHSTPSSSRPLAKDPNGPIYYLGGGSARSRYRSSAFRSTGQRMDALSSPIQGESITSKVNGVPETPSPSDGKRRRVGEDRESSVAQASGPYVSAPNGTNTPSVEPSSTINFDTSTAASRFLATPVRPSPLRQTMRADSSSPASPSSGSINGDSPSPMVSNIDEEQRSRVNDKASEVASEIMAGIISDATKDSVPDLRNPYQRPSRAPMMRPRKVKTPRPLPHSTRWSAEPLSTEPKKMSALETIQSTAPQAQTGSKRSHTGMPPPASPSVFVNGTSNGTGVFQTGLNVGRSVVISLDEDEPQEPPAKKQKSEQLSATKKDKCLQVEPSKNTVQAEEVKMIAIDTDNVSRPNEAIELDNQAQIIQDQTMQQQQEMKRPIFTAPFMKAAAATRFHTAPKEPSPLRQSFQPDMPPSPPTDSSLKKISTPQSPSSSALTSGPSAFTATSAPTSSPTSLALSPFAPTTSAPTTSSTSSSAPSPFAPTTSAPTTSSPTSLAPSPFAPTTSAPTSSPTSLAPSPFAATSAPSPFGQTSAFGSTSGSSVFGSMSGPSAFAPKSTASSFGSTSSSLPFGSTSAASPTQKPALSPFALSSSANTSFGSTSNPSAFGSTPGPSPFGLTSNSSAFGSTPGPSPFGSTSNPSAFGSTPGPSPFGLTSNPSAFGSTPGPSPFGSTSNPAVFGSTPGPSPFGSTSNPSAFGSTPGPSPFGLTSNPSAFGSTPGPSPFGSTSNPAVFGSTPGPSPFGSTSNPAVFGSTPDPSPFGSTPGPTPFGSTSNPSAFGSTSGPSPFSPKKSDPSSFESDPAVQKSGSSSFASTSTPFGPAVLTSPFAPAKSEPSPFSIPPAPAPAKDVLPANATAPIPSASLSATTNADKDWITFAKAQVLDLPINALPTFTLPFTTHTTSPVYVDQRDAALAVPTSDLPKYNFEVRPESSPVAASTPIPAPKAEVKTFDWAAAGMKVPTRTGWPCEVCSCQNAEGTSKCNVCGKVQGPAPKGAVKGFDWAAAGMKVPSRTGWTCGLCSCQNPDGSFKCNVCGEKKP